MKFRASDNITLQDRVMFGGFALCWPCTLNLSDTIFTRFPYYIATNENEHPKKSLQLSSSFIFTIKLYITRKSSCFKNYGFKLQDEISER